jgi:hypothetical protein
MVKQVERALLSGEEVEIDDKLAEFRLNEKKIFLRINFVQEFFEVEFSVVRLGGIRFEREEREGGNR